MSEETHREYIKRLMSMPEIEKLGKGRYGHVFQSPAYGNVAVKVFSPRVDTHYKKYVDWCLKHQDNRFVPKIAEVRYVASGAKGTGRIGIVFMEKLRKASPVSIKREAIKWASIPLQQGGVDVQNFEDWDREDWDAIARLARDPAVAEMAKFFALFPWTDIHNENIMVNSNRQLVFTDPLAP